MWYNPDLCRDSFGPYSIDWSDQVKMNLDSYCGISFSPELIDACGRHIHQIQEAAEKHEKEEKRRKERIVQARNKRLRALVKHVHWSGNTCIVYWNDGTQTKAHWDPMENYDPEKAILVCMARKLYENTSVYNEVLKEYADDGWVHYTSDEWYV